MKVDARVPVPEELDLSSYRGKGVQPGEVLIPETAEASVPGVQAGGTGEYWLLWWGRVLGGVVELWEI